MFFIKKKNIKKIFKIQKKRKKKKKQTNNNSNNKFILIQYSLIIFRTKKCKNEVVLIKVVMGEIPVTKFIAR